MGSGCGEWRVEHYHGLRWFGVKRGLTCRLDPDPSEKLFLVRGVGVLGQRHWARGHRSWLMSGSVVGHVEQLGRRWLVELVGMFLPCRISTSPSGTLIEWTRFVQWALIDPTLAQISALSSLSTRQRSFLRRNWTQWRNWQRCTRRSKNVMIISWESGFNFRWRSMVMLLQSRRSAKWNRFHRCRSART